MAVIYRDNYIDRVIKDEDIRYIRDANALHIDDASEFFAEAEVKSAILDIFYPIGSLYMATSLDADPNELFGGTWTQIKDKFILAAGDTYTAGDSGGDADAVVVSHSHTATVASNGAHTHTVSGRTVPSGAHSHGTGSSDRPDFNVMNKDDVGRRDLGGSGKGYQWTTDSTASNSAIGTRSATSEEPNHLHLLTGTAASNGAHTHTATVASRGESGTGKNMPPYLVCCIWQREA